jgi:alpha-galactosidase
MKKRLLLILNLFFLINAFSQKWEGLALTPPMGWNSWNTFAADISEAVVKKTADAMISSGMKAAGYQYLVIDDGWMAMERDSITGDLVPDPKKFPNGLKKLVDYVHSKGLKFGIYNCAGTKTCGGYPGTRGYEYQDARFYARMGVDYLKYDWCFTDGINAKEAYTTMSKAIKKAGRPMVFSLCEWGSNQPWEWAGPVGHLWRTTGDIYPCFDCIKDHGTWKAYGVMPIVNMRQGIRRHAGPGHWNDPDMMEVGKGMTAGEDRAHISLWAMMAAPLIAGNDITQMSEQTKSILTDKDVIAIDQDPLGVQGFLLNTDDSVQTWIRPLLHDEWAVCFVNTSREPKTINFDWQRANIADTLSKTHLNVMTAVYRIYNCWEKKQAGSTTEAFLTTVAPHDVVLLRLTKL